MDELTSRERLGRAFRREPTDRVPVCTYELVGWDDEAWFNREPSYQRLMQEVRARSDCLFMLGYGGGNWLEAERRTVEEWRQDNRRYRRSRLDTPKGLLTSVQMEQDDIRTVWTTEHLLKDLDDLDKWFSIPYEPEPIEPEPYRRTRERLGDRGLMAVDVSNPICTLAELFEFGEFLIQATTNRRQIKRAMDVVFERQYEALRRALDAGFGESFRLVGAEYASAPYLSTDDFRDLVLPYERGFINLIHRYGHFARIHCHGRVRELLRLFIEAGADGTDPVEAPPSGDVTLAEAKRICGDRLTLFGNVQLRDLEYAEPEQIEAIVRDCFTAAKQRGGYVLMPTASPINIPLNPRTEQNYFRFLDAAERWGRY